MIIVTMLTILYLRYVLWSNVYDWLNEVYENPIYNLVYKFVLIPSVIFFPWMLMLYYVHIILFIILLWLAIWIKIYYKNKWK